MYMVMWSSAGFAGEDASRRHSEHGQSAFHDTLKQRPVRPQPNSATLRSKCAEVG